MENTINNNQLTGLDKQNLAIAYIHTMFHAMNTGRVLTKK